MARTRHDLHEILCGILESRNVYFRQPSKGMSYPCIKYDLTDKDSDYADNIPYIKRKRWTITIIDENPDSLICERLEELPYCNFDRPYQSDGLNHFIYTLYF